jgi:hypothetical protein
MCPPIVSIGTPKGKKISSDGDLRDLAVSTQRRAQL